MFERFTDRSRRVVVLGQEEARSRGHRRVGTEHLLLGLIREGGGEADAALGALGISLEDVGEEVETIIGKEERPILVHIPFSLGAKKALDLSQTESVRFSHHYVGTEHLLLGLVAEGNGIAAMVLMKRGADLASLREQVESGFQ